MASKTQGFTLVDLLTTLAALAALLAMAVPAFVSVMDSVRQRTEVNQLLANLNFARTQAITSKRAVSICSGEKGCSRLRVWSGQILVFEDLKGSGTLDSVDALLRTTPIASRHEWTWRNFRKQRHITFKPDGTTHSLNGTFILCRERVALKKVVINVTGRARLATPTPEDVCT